MLSKRQQTWAKKAEDRLSTVGAAIASEWQGEHGPLTITCPHEHKFETTWHRTVACLNRSGLVGCPTCASEAKSSFHRGDESATQALTDHGFTLLSDYRNGYSPLTLKCDRGHTHTRTFKAWKKSEVKCQECFREDIHNQFEREGWTVVTPFEGVKAKMTVKCPEGHQSNIKYQVWSRPRKPGYNGCNQCKPVKHGQDRALSLSEVESSFRAKGFRLSGEYLNASVPAQVVCDRGHITFVALKNLRCGSQGKCGECHREDRKPSPEQEASNLAAQRISTRIYQELVKVGRRNKGWHSRSWARVKSEEIASVLGQRPEGSHLDHVIPCSFFDFKEEGQVKLCWAIDNLRWMEASANISRGNRLTLEEAKSLTPEQLALLLQAKFAPKELLSGLGWYV
jgi:hypothetical protein